MGYSTLPKRAWYSVISSPKNPTIHMKYKQIGVIRII